MKDGMPYMIGDVRPEDAKHLLDIAKRVVGVPNGQVLNNTYFVAVRRSDFERLKLAAEARIMDEADGAARWDDVYPDLFKPTIEVPA